MRSLFIFSILALNCLLSLPSLAIKPDGRLDDFEEEAVRSIVGNLRPTGTLSDLGGEDALTLILESTNGLLSSGEEMHRAAVSIFLADEGLLEDGATKVTALHDAPSHAASAAASTSESDALLARALQEQLTLQMEEERGVRQAAAALEEQSKREVYASHHTRLAEREAHFSPHRRALTDIFEACPPYANGDVHAFNKGIVHSHYPIVQEIDGLLFHDEMRAAEGLTPADTIQEIKAFATEGALDSRFPSAAAYFPVIMRNVPGKIEAETGVDPLSLFPRLWRLALATDADSLKKHQFQLPDESIVDARTFLYYSLHENYAEQGGCWPGFAGRLFQVYLQILSARIS